MAYVSIFASNVEMANEITLIVIIPDFITYNMDASATDDTRTHAYTFRKKQRMSI